MTAFEEVLVKGEDEVAAEPLARTFLLRLVTGRVAKRREVMALRPLRRAFERLALGKRRRFGFLQFLPPPAITALPLGGLAQAFFFQQHEPTSAKQKNPGRFRGSRAHFAVW